ncbi:MAG: hypothetical protein P8N02_20450, partial [Actinomycetota bacterium]|nr:hypothetical protein [Actinomycetota bacterium]
NIIIGKLIPAGTGQGRYRNIETTAPEYVPMDFYSSEEDPAEWLASIGGEDGEGNGSTNGNGAVIGIGDAG